MQITDYLKLNVPELTDSPPDITKISDNFPKIDANAKSIGEQINNFVSQQVSHSGNFTRDSQLTGMQKITLPFKAKAIILYATVLATSGKASWGMVDKDLNNKAIFDSHNQVANSYNGSPAQSIYINEGSNETVGSVTLIEDDGFTINWSKNGTGATGTIYIYYTALR